MRIVYGQCYVPSDLAWCVQLFYQSDLLNLTGVPYAHLPISFPAYVCTTCRKFEICISGTDINEDGNTLWHVTSCIFTM